MLYKGVLEEDSLDNYLSREGASICQFLYFLHIDDIKRSFKTSSKVYRLLYD